jgi:hypothetical protein
MRASRASIACCVMRPLAACLPHCFRGIGLALFGRFLRRVEQHHLDAGRAVDIAMPAPIMPAPSMPIRVFLHRHAGRARSQLVGVLHAEEQAADHVLRHRGQRQVGEVARLDRQARVEVGRQALVDAGQDVLRRRVVVEGLLAQHGVGRHQHLHAVGRVRAAAGDLEALAIPGLQRLLCRMRWHRAARCVPPVTFLAAGNHGMDHADFQRLAGVDALAFHQQRRRRLHADQARQALRAAGARQQPQGDFGEAEARLRVVGSDAVMAGQREFHAAAQRAAVDAAATGLPPSSMRAQEFVPFADCCTGRPPRRSAPESSARSPPAMKSFFAEQTRSALDRRVGQRLAASSDEGVIERG